MPETTPTYQGLGCLVVDIIMSFRGKGEIK